MAKADQKKSKNVENLMKSKGNKLPDDPQRLWGMSSAPELTLSTHWFQILPLTIFTAVVVMLVRMRTYERDMSEFYWYAGGNELTDFFSLVKSELILWMAVLALVILLYNVFAQNFYVKRTWVYIPAGIYLIFVFLSYLFSDYKEIALWGYNDRFEGTLIVLSYILMLLYAVNKINTEKNVKMIVYPLGITSFGLGLLGLTQYLDQDFFRTAFGKKLITPSWYWEHVDGLNFTFQNREIYQTVYNINYVSFYLAMLIPLFGMLLMQKMGVKKKIVFSILWAVLLINIIGSASSGGFAGLGVTLVVALILLNKRLLTWKKSVAIIIGITIVVGGVTADRFMAGMTDAYNGIFPRGTVTTDESQFENPADSATEETVPSDTPKKPSKIDYIINDVKTIEFSIEGNKIFFDTALVDGEAVVNVKDDTGKKIDLLEKEDGTFSLRDSRFSMVSAFYQKDENANNYFIVVTDEQMWPFVILEEETFYYTGVGKIVSLEDIPHWGFETNDSWGSGRGYIWSRSFPMIKDTLIIGNGADTYCVEFPHKDYAGKYSSPTYRGSINIIVDKPHNMYIGMATNTGIISLLAWLALVGIYCVQSFKIYFRKEFETFIDFAGAGIFLGIIGFLVAGIVNDSTVSVMPMFYGLLGTGIAINLRQERIKLIK